MAKQQNFVFLQPSDHTIMTSLRNDQAATRFQKAGGRRFASVALTLLLTTSAMTLSLYGVALADGGKGGGQGAGLQGGSPGGSGYEGDDGENATDPNWVHAGGGGGSAGGGQGGVGGPGLSDTGQGGAGGDGGLNNQNGGVDGDGKAGENGKTNGMGGSPGGGGSGGGGGMGGAGFYYPGDDVQLSLVPGLTDVLGGKGGAGGKGWAKGGAGGGGGDGGGGIVMANGHDVIVDIETVTGGAGGRGGDGADVGPPGIAALGGKGGGGVVILGGGDVTVDGAVVTGGKGGDGGDGNNTANMSNLATGGYGGAGGGGIETDGGNVTLDAGSVTGGEGGIGGHGGTGANAGNGGDGGAGVYSVGAATITVGSGVTVTGGKGGAAGTTDVPGIAGKGGVGIVASGGTVLTVAGTVTGGMDGTNTVQADAISLFGGGNTLVLEGGDYAFNGGVSSEGINGGDTLALGGDADAVFSLASLNSTFADFTALDKIGSSIWTLAGSTSFTGPTTVSEGTLSLNGASLGNSDMTVEADGMLAVDGNSTVKSLDAAGAVAMNDVDTKLTVSNGVSFATGSTYDVVVDNDGRASWISAAGSVSDLQGGIVQVTAGPGAYDATTHYVILVDNGRNGSTFDGVEMAGPSFLAPTLHYDATEVYLTFATDFGGAAETSNQAQVAGALDDWGLDGALATALLSVDAADAPRVFDALSGEAYASAQSFMLEESHIVRDAMVGRLLGDGPEPGNHLWGKLYGDWSSADGDGNATGYTGRSSGLLVGADGRLGDWRVGTLVGYGRGTLDVSGTGASAGIDGYHIGVYAGTSAGNLQLRGGAAFTWQDVAMTRGVAFGGLDEDLSGNYGAATKQGFAELGYKIDLDGASIEPFGNLAAITLGTEGLSEEGGDAALHVQGADADAILATLGLHASTAFSLGDIAVTAEATIGWQHAFADTPGNTMHFEGGSAFDVAGTPLATDAAVVNAAVDLNFAPGATLGLSYGGQLASGATRQSATAELDVKF